MGRLLPAQDSSSDAGARDDLTGLLWRLQLGEQQAQCVDEPSRTRYRGLAARAAPVLVEQIADGVVAREVRRSPGALVVSQKSMVVPHIARRSMRLLFSVAGGVVRGGLLAVRFWECSELLSPRRLREVELG